MGHSQVGFIVRKKCTTSEIRSEYESKVNEHRSMYGYEEHCSSYYRAEYPSAKYLGPVYTESGMRKLEHEMNSYDSLVFYFLPNEECQKLFKKEYKVLNNLKNKIKDLEKQQKEYSSNFAKDSLITKAIEGKNNLKFIIKCPHCNSSINMVSYHKTRGLKSPDKCPICNIDDGFSSKWYKKMYGSKKNKSINFKIKIEKLKKQIEEIEKSIPDIISSSLLTKKIEKAICTYFVADVHH